jgi:hypothetical protein
LARTTEATGNHEGLIIILPGGVAMQEHAGAIRDLGVSDMVAIGVKPTVYGGLQPDYHQGPLAHSAGTMQRENARSCGKSERGEGNHDDVRLQ